MMLRLLLALAAVGFLAACEMNQVADPQMEAGEALGPGDDTDGDPTFDAESDL